MLHIRCANADHNGTDIFRRLSSDGWCGAKTEPQEESNNNGVAKNVK